MDMNDQHDPRCHLEDGHEGGCVYSLGDEQPDTPDYGTHTTPEELETIPLEDKFEHLGELNRQMENKLQYAVQYNIDIPALALTKLRLEYWLGLLAEKLDDGQNWLADGEIGWAESMIDSLDTALREAKANQLQAVLDLDDQ